MFLFASSASAATWGAPGEASFQLVPPTSYLASEDEDEDPWEEEENEVEEEGRKQGYEGDEPGECSDDADNDQDGLFDCDDPNCAGSKACRDEEPIPLPAEKTGPANDEDTPAVPAASTLPAPPSGESLRTARRGHATATGVGIPPLVAGLSLTPFSFVFSSLVGPPTISLGLVWGSFGASLGGALIAHGALPNFKGLTLAEQLHLARGLKTGLETGMVLGITGSVLYTCGTILFGAFYQSGYGPLGIILGVGFVAVGMGLAIAGNVTLMASALAVTKRLSAGSAAQSSAKKKPRFSALPLLAPTKNGLLLGAAGRF